MEKYIGTKIVEAEPANGPKGLCGYTVRYKDGYVSWSPDEAFEEAYREVSKGITFGDALYFLKKGTR